MNEEEKIFNKILDVFKQNILNKSTLTALECAEIINIDSQPSFKGLAESYKFYSWECEYNGRCKMD